MPDNNTLDALSQTLSASLSAANLVPGPAEGLIPRNFKPTTRLSISFDGKDVELGNLFRVNEVKLAPFVSFEAEPNAPEDASYMLLLVDPDAPTPDDPKFAFWRHWVLPGLKPLAGSGAHGVVAQTKPVLTEYLAPGPKDESQPHRYLFLLYREPHGLALTKEDVGGEEFVQRRSFDPVKFVEKHQLQLVGLNWMKGAGDGWKEQGVNLTSSARGLRVTHDFGARGSGWGGNGGAAALTHFCWTRGGRSMTSGGADVKLNFSVSGRLPVRARLVFRGALDEGCGQGRVAEEPEGRGSLMAFAASDSIRATMEGSISSFQAFSLSHQSPSMPAHTYDSVPARAPFFLHHGSSAGMDRWTSIAGCDAAVARCPPSPMASCRKRRRQQQNFASSSSRRHPHSRCASSPVGAKVIIVERMQSATLCRLCGYPPTTLGQPD
ncbi:hypothetical protein TgHK011_002567 [Trichoderma gracile]|nr:hypothetical protein TgHK011_002567 [Trichoderma gracile]